MVGKKRRSDIVFYTGEPDTMDNVADELPTYRQVLNYYQLLCIRGESMENQGTVYQIARIVSSELIEIWERILPDLPLLLPKTILNKILCLLKLYEAATKSMLKAMPLASLEASLDVLLDISKCRCNLEERECSHHLIDCKAQDCFKTHYSCECPAPKVPDALRGFLKDQRIKIGPQGMYLCQ